MKICTAVPGMLTAVLRTVLLLTTLGVSPWVVAATIDANKPTVLITGANRGIGLAFTDHYINDGWNVIATARAPERADDLLNLAENHENLLIEQLDVTDHGRIRELAETFSDTPIDVLLNNAGVLGALEEQSLGNFDRETFEHVMAVNVLAPLKMIEAFADHVAASKQRKIVTITSGAGVQSRPLTSGGRYYYRISKTSVNMLMRIAQADLADRGIILIPIAPGMVRTDMLREAFGGNLPPAGAGGMASGPLMPAESVAGMVRVIESVDPDYDGRPLNHDGSTLPW